MRERNGISNLCKLLVLTIVAGVGPAAAQSRQSIPATSLSPRPVVITGKQVSGVTGLPIESISLARCVQNSLAALPFQIDERNADGYIVPGQPHPSVKPDEQPGIFDDNDEIVFMFREITPGCETLPEGIAEKVIPVRIESEYFNPPRYIYVLVNAARKPPVPVYVRHDPVRDRTSSPFFEFGYDPKNAAIFDHLVISQIRGLEKANIIDRLKVRIISRAVADLITIRLNEDHLKSTLYGYRAGPLRVSRLVNVVLTPVPGFTIPVTVETTQYDRLWDARVSFTLPRSLTALMSSQEMFFIVDFRDLRGTTFVTVANPQGAVIDGITQDEEKQLNLGAEHWFFITGRGANALMMMDTSPNLQLKFRADFVDDATYANPPENVVGGLPSAGFHLTGWEQIRSGSYWFFGRFVTLPGFPEDGGAGWYQAFNSPIKTIAEPAR
ncbi:MAG: hypothetical protein KIT79_09865 [Deltaproteobacteria bacterium]|nr:hypothetical protein [Deltaproteobacteria bacterium]